MGQICVTCKHIGNRCYCSPNSTCEYYERQEQDDFEYAMIKTYNETEMITTKKQYRYNAGCFGKYYLYIYNDGKLIEKKILWGDEFDEEVDRLIEEGYTYGFTNDEVENAKQKYERMLLNVIDIKC